MNSKGRLKIPLMSRFAWDAPVGSDFARGAFVNYNLIKRMKEFEEFNGRVGILELSRFAWAKPIRRDLVRGPPSVYIC